MKPRVDLRTNQRLHIVGVGGPGMSAVALALVQMGHAVSGSDIRETPVMARLRAAGIDITIGHDARLVDGCDAVTASPAVPDDNVEIRAARSNPDRLVTRAEMLASICAVVPSLAVAGTHGKTTTTSLLVHIFEEVGLQPNFVVGGDILGLDTSARWTGGTWTIVEADESDGTHLELPLAGTILTNVDVDHLDHYGDFAGIVDSFTRYLAGIEGPKVVCADDETLMSIRASAKKSAGFVTYGHSPDADVRFDRVRSDQGMTKFSVLIGEQEFEVETALRGLHNVSNVTASIAMAVQCGVDPGDAAAAVRSFQGVGRRFDVRGRLDGVTFVDDYAHLPREIDAVLTAARTSGDGWRRIVAVFQPNRYNRMSKISAEYADAFRSADLVVLTDIYSSGTARIEGVTGHLVVDAVVTRHPETEVIWIEDRRKLAEGVSDLLESGDVCISMGCGDIETLPEEIMSIRRSAREP